MLIADDVTSMVQNEKLLHEQKEALGHFSRFAAVCEVAAGISHEIGAPLNAITTKSQDQGTGIGLSPSRSIARRHGGDLELLRERDNTTFRLTLPKRSATDAAQKDAP